MGERGKSPWSLVGNGVFILVLGTFFAWLGYSYYTLPTNWPPEVSGPYVVQGVFPFSTMEAENTGPYLFQAEDGAERQFYCDRVWGGRGPQYNICLHPARGNPAGELGGRRLEVRYLALQYRANWLGASGPHLVILSIRENGRVLFRNNLWIRTS